jgi:hypothetical protein
MVERHQLPRNWIDHQHILLQFVFEAFQKSLPWLISLQQT